MGRTFSVAAHTLRTLSHKIFAALYLDTFQNTPENLPVHQVKTVCQLSALIIWAVLLYVNSIEIVIRERMIRGLRREDDVLLVS